MTLEELAKWLDDFDECGSETRNRFIAAATALRELADKRKNPRFLSQCSQMEDATDAALERIKP